MTVRRVCVGVLGVFALPLTFVALAWACAPQAAITVSPQSADPGATVTVRGSGFPFGSIVLHWDAISGPTVGSAYGPSFSTTATIPGDAAPSVHYIVATDTGATMTAIAPLQVNQVAAPVAPPADPALPAPDPAGINPFLPPPDAAVAAPAVYAYSPPTSNVINGTDGDDRLVGTPGRDVINCGAGNDVVVAGAGADLISCGGGNDRVDGGAGNDVIRGASGDDRLIGGSGADELSGGSGVDDLRGSAGADRLSGGAGRDTLHTDALDRIIRGPGPDRITR